MLPSSSTAMRAACETRGSPRHQQHRPGPGQDHDEAGARREEASDTVSVQPDGTLRSYI